MKKRVADIIVDTLADSGVSQAFCVVGGGAMYLDNALSRTKRIKTVFNHHEQACAIAAEGYARFFSCEKMALVCVTTGPGGTNALTGVMGAYVDNIPLVVISGQCRYDTSIPQSGLPLRTRGVQEFNIVDTVKTMTKYAKLVVDPLSVRREITKAVDVAMSGRKGPVWIDVPQNVQNAFIEEEALLPECVNTERVTAEQGKIDAVQELLASARRPVILVGSAVRTSGCRDAFEQFLSRVSIPVVGACVQPDVFYRDHPLYCGASGSVGTRAGNFVLQSADVLLVLGAALSYYETGFVQEAFAPHARIVMINVDEFDHRKPGLRVDEFVHCELKEFFRLSRGWNMSAPVGWLRFVCLAKDHFDVFEGAMDGQGDGVDAYDFWKRYTSLEASDSITVLGNNSGVCPRLQSGCFGRDQRTLNNVNCGSMGWDIPAALGACVAAGRPVNLVTGDGSFMMNSQELATIAYNCLPVRVVVLANGGYGGIRQTCKNYFNGCNFGCDAQSGIGFPDFKLLAESYGIEYRKCKTIDELDDALDWYFSRNNAVLMEVCQRLDNPPVPRVVSRLLDNGKSEPAMLHVMYPFLSQEEQEEFGRYV